LRVGSIWILYRNWSLFFLAMAWSRITRRSSELAGALAVWLLVSLFMIFGGLRPVAELGR
jgi:hypothetical protein